MHVRGVCEGCVHVRGVCEGCVHVRGVCEGCVYEGVCVRMCEVCV